MTNVHVQQKTGIVLIYLYNIEIAGKLMICTTYFVLKRVANAWLPASA